jgi:hypothetical protein
MDGLPLSEVNKWDLEDVHKYHIFMNMKNDYSDAFDGYNSFQSDKIRTTLGK